MSIAEINIGLILLLVMTQGSFECGVWSVELGAAQERLRAFGFCVAGRADQNVRVVRVRAVPAGGFSGSGGGAGQGRFREFEVAMAAARQTRLRRMAAVWTKHL